MKYTINSMIFIIASMMFVFVYGCIDEPVNGAMTAYSDGGSIDGIINEPDAGQSQDSHSDEVKENICDDGIPCTEDYYDKKTGKCQFKNNCVSYSVTVDTKTVDTDKYYQLIRIISPYTTWKDGNSVWIPKISRRDTTLVLEEFKSKGGSLSVHTHSDEMSHICLQLVSAQKKGLDYPMVFQAFNVDHKNGKKSLLVPSMIDVEFSVTSSKYMTKVFNLTFAKTNKTPGYLIGDAYEKYGYYVLDNFVELCKPYAFETP